MLVSYDVNGQPGMIKVATVRVLAKVSLARREPSRHTSLDTLATRSWPVSPLFAASQLQAGASAETKGVYYVLVL